MQELHIKKDRHAPILWNNFVSWEKDINVTEEQTFQYIVSSSKE